MAKQFSADDVEADSPRHFPKKGPEPYAPDEERELRLKVERKSPWAARLFATLDRERERMKELEDDAVRTWPTGITTGRETE